MNTMENHSEAIRLRIVISSLDKINHKPLYEEIVFAAKRFGLAGATVLKGIMGFSESGVIYSRKLFEITEKVPVVIEIIDEPEKIRKFTDTILPLFDKTQHDCMISHEMVTVVMHKKNEKHNV